MQLLTVNLTGAIRTEQLMGEDHLVVSMVMINPGVLVGSDGPLYYPPEEVSKGVENWNNVPVTIGHPRDQNGKPQHARTFTALDKFAIGRVLNSKVDDRGRLIGEAWIAVNRVKRLSPYLLSRLQSNTPTELSTGLFLDQHPADPGAVYNGKPYSYIARNYRPDHLAVLLDEVGACSVDDGCGLNVNQKKRGSLMDKKKVIDEIIANSCCWDEDNRLVLEGMGEEVLERLQAQTKSEKDNAGKAAVFNDAKEYVNTDGKRFVLNEKKQWEEKPVEKPKVKEEPKPAENKKEPPKDPPKPKTTDEWLKEAPPEIQSAVRNAMEIENRERDQLIEQLTVNLEGDAKQRITDRLKAKPIDELRDLIALVPEKEKATANYAGAAAGVVDNRGKAAEADKKDFLPLPRMDFVLEKASA